MLRMLRRIRETSENDLPPDAPSLTPDHVAVIYVDPSRVFRSRSVDQGDMPGAWHFPEGRAEGHPFGGD